MSFKHFIKKFNIAISDFCCNICNLFVPFNGDYFSIRQSGIPDFVFADFSKDIELFKIINKDAEELFLMQEYDSEIKRYIQKIIDQIEIKNQLN
jgi:hypothetical protein